MPKHESKQVMHVPLELKELDESGNFVGYASVFGNLDSYRDVMIPGSFEKTLKKSGGILPILADHDPYKQIGWNTEAEEDSKGLKVTGQLNLEVQLAKERYALTKQAKEAGAKSGLSIGYVTKVSEWDENKKVRSLIEVDLWEYSFVTFPANTRATVMRVKNIMENLGLTTDFVDDPKSLEAFLCEAGFSNSVSKKVAAGAVAMHKKDHPADELLGDPESLCEADQKAVEAMMQKCSEISNL
jgi:HK97 family phage prohead protease